jgi:hypothetical protein
MLARRDYHVMAQNLSEGKEVKGKGDTEVITHVTGRNEPLATVSIPLITAIGGDELLCSAHAQKLSSAHVSSHCDLDVYRRQEGGTSGRLTLT